MFCFSIGDDASRWDGMGWDGKETKALVTRLGTVREEETRIDKVGIEIEATGRRRRTALPPSRLRTAPRRGIQTTGTEPLDQRRMERNQRLLQRLLCLCLCLCFCLFPSLPCLALPCLALPCLYGPYWSQVWAFFLLRLHNEKKKPNHHHQQPIIMF